jgi:hypothetical protein
LSAPCRRAAPPHCSTNRWLAAAVAADAVAEEVADEQPSTLGWAGPETALEPPREERKRAIPVKTKERKRRI